jgi:hypothetical protein
METRAEVVEGGEDPEQNTKKAGVHLSGTGPQLKDAVRLEREETVL